MKITYTFSFTVNAEASDARIEANDLQAVMMIPDGYTEKELRQIITAMEMELPYYQYKNTEIQRKNIEIEHVPAKEFSISGNNIGEMQRSMMEHAFKALQADIAIQRRKEYRKMYLRTAAEAIKTFFEAVWDFIIAAPPSKVRLKSLDVEEERKHEEDMLKRLQHNVGVVEKKLDRNDRVYEEISEKMLEILGRDDTGVWR